MQSRAGRPKLVCAAHVTIMFDMILRVTSKYCLSTTMAQALVIKQLKVLAVEKEPSKWWVMRLLHTMGLMSGTTIDSMAVH
eukprot:3833311-Amphidinium_carterae.1